ncbi:hypothetical protein DPMN_009697 [Dreissena polymorpha]|uniref:Uncharacterized protein n=1 Tax=Dreissena polymorpha TaxID=45954 RepID=A0A9D4N0X0_DREPO|nr:hypothetical protein DPMN_009697 [Dreissena polymorpha]
MHLRRLVRGDAVRYKITQCVMVSLCTNSADGHNTFRKQHLGTINVALEHQRFCNSYQQIIDANGWADLLEIVQCEDENDIPESVFISCFDIDNDSRDDIARELDKHHIRHEHATGNSSRISEGKLRVLLVLRSGVNISDVPRFVRWNTCFSEDEKSYKNWIVRTVSGAPVDIRRALPAGDVIPGLCWAYVLNYLKIILTTSKYLTNKDLNCGYIRKLIVVWVKSCDMENTLDVVTNKSGGRRKIASSGPIKVTTNSLGGQIGRPFDVHMFSYTDESIPGNQMFPC